jgi:hypothetical protein
MVSPSSTSRAPITGIALAVLVAIHLSGAEAKGQDTKAVIDYASQVRPLLTKHCVSCHGPAKQRAGIRLDTGVEVLRGGKGGAVVVPHKSGESPLIKAVLGLDDLAKMPKDAAPLSDAEVALLRAWIDQGARIPKDEAAGAAAFDPARHWAFVPPVKPVLPDVKRAGWSKHPIDALLAAEHEKRGLTPAGPAPREVLLRRVYLDLTGLPPTVEERAAFLADESADAYERTVARLLASPRYGERWGRHWMDIWRYSDWYGYGGELRNSQKHLWRWRDWIINSLNDDKPYDRMIVEMLAADEAYPDDAAVLPATGYLARSYYKFSRDVWLDSIVEHTNKAFLGITMNCARCHDHKYDPIDHGDYYAMRAFFEPHQIRADRVPGQANVDIDGLTRVFDADAKAPTYLYERGDEKRPVKDKPLSPHLPRVLGGELAIAEVRLPAAASYAGLKPFVQREALAAAKQAVISADSALAKTRTAGAAADIEVAEKQLKAVRAALAAVEARIAADVAKYASPPGTDAEDLAKSAAAAVRREAYLTADASLADAQKKLAYAEAAAKAGDAKQAKAAEEMKKQLADLTKKRDDAKAALATIDGTYPPLSTIYPATSTGRRLALARWITDRGNPLTARVAVNHIWARHFGQPLVPTVFDFGLNGKPPVNPRVLDFLAVEFMEHGWSMKHLHRLIVTSQAYQMASSTAAPASASASGDERPAAFRVGLTPNVAASATIDPDNLHLWHMNPRRLEAEAIRDSLIHIAGKLDLTTGGPELDQNAGLTTYRRSIYYRCALEKQMQFLTIFDAPSPTEGYRRATTVVPQQALALANSSLALDMAKALATDITAKLGAARRGDDAFIGAAYLCVLCRDATAEERAACAEFLVQEGQPRAKEDLIHVLMNHHEFVTVR